MKVPKWLVITGIVVIAVLVITIATGVFTVFEGIKDFFSGW